MPDALENRSWFHASVVLFVVFVCVVIVVLDAFQIRAAHDVPLQQAAMQTDNLARSLARHAQDVFETADSILKVLRERVVNEGTDPAAIQRLDRAMRIRVSSQDLVQRVFILDETGTMIATSLNAADGVRVQAASFADRAYFRFHAGHAADDVLISSPFRTRFDDTWVVTVSRRISHPDGGFAGVVGASIPLDLFQRYFATFDLGQHGTITLMTGGGVVLVRRPFIEANVGLDAAGTPAYRAMAGGADGASFSVPSALDGSIRIGSFRRVPGFDLAMIVALDRTEVLAPWWRQTRRNLSGVALIVAFTGFLGYRIAREVRQRFRAEALLTEAGSLLEDRVQQRTAELQAMVGQRDALLREVYHRVRNNLQVVDALLALESRGRQDSPMREGLAELRSRIHTLGLAHQQLMSSESLERFPLAPFLRDIADFMAGSAPAVEHGITVTVQAAPVIVDLDFAIPIGMLITELLMNAFNHARATQIVVDFALGDDGEGILAVSDNGSNVEVRVPRTAAHVGAAGILVSGFIKQLGGHMNVSSSSTTRVEIRMPMPVVS